jgi:hypothetical protein
MTGETLLRSDAVHLLLMIAIAPASTVRGNVLLGGLAECQGLILLGLLMTQGSPLGVFLNQRVQTLGQAPARVLSLLMGSREGDVGIAPQTHPMCVAIARVSEHPDSVEASRALPRA